MDALNDLTSFLSLINACFCRLELKYRSVVYAYYKNKILVKNTTFEEFFSRMAFEFGFLCKDEMIEDVYNYAMDTTTNDYVFFAPNMNSERKTIAVTKTYLEDGSIGLYFDNLDEKRGLLNLMDPLTSTYQKMAFENYVEKKHNSDNKPYSLFIADIDNFKGINDNYGHMVGDQILKNVAQVLKKNLKNGAVGRYGGDEFVCVSYQAIDYQDIWNVLYKITHEMYDVGSMFEKPVDVSVTIGVSRYGTDGTKFDELFMKADRALYRGKRKGKDCFIIYDDEKHKNINLDGVRKTIIDDRDARISAPILISSIYEIISKDGATYNESLRSISEFISSSFSADRCVLYLESFDRYETPISYCFKESTLESTIDLEKKPADIWDMHIKNNVISFNKVITLKGVNVPLYERLSKEGCASVLRVPLKYGSNVLGAIEIDSFTQREWSIEEKNAMITLSNYLSVFMYKINENMYLEYKSIMDPLTQTLTYPRFVADVKKDLSESNGFKEMYYLNLNKFKLFNDRFGFKAGDAILKKIADYIKRIFKTGNYIARVNGDRFLFYRNYTSDEEINEKFNKFIDQLHATLQDNAQKDYLSITCGVYVSDGSENIPSVMIDNANVARKFIDVTQNNGIMIYTKQIKEQYEFKRQLEIHFPVALQKEEFAVFLQPKINMESGELVGAEALSRWRYKGDKILPPIDYIPTLESSGQIEALDLYVFEHICDYLKKLDDLGKKKFRISINISRSVENILNYVDEIEEIRNRYDVDPKYLEIEITESMFNADIDMIVKSIAKLHNLGYKIAMDDFGSGYSNLASLAECGFDVIKIDKSLCPEHEMDKRIIVLNAVVQLSDQLGAAIVCEGVEEEGQRKILLSNGCKIAQGYLYDKPIPLSDFTNKYL